MGRPIDLVDKTWLRHVTLLFVLTLANACAIQSPGPYEGFNRSVHNFNSGVDRATLKPLARGYRAVMPDAAERSVSNVFSNLADPFVALNQLLQGKPKLALQDSVRFFVNSTVGMLGIFNVASQLGLAKHQEDFGQTLAVWGVPQGPYLVLPFWGPSNPRDGFGDLVGSLGFIPRYWDDVAARNITTAVWVIQRRASFLDADRLVTGDVYTFYRDAFLQRRAYLIADGEQTSDPFIDDVE